jgi:hypothetical protein
MFSSEMVAFLSLNSDWVIGSPLSEKLSACWPGAPICFGPEQEHKTKLISIVKQVYFIFKMFITDFYYYTGERIFNHLSS